jgi:hypothetical protein
MLRYVLSRQIDGFQRRYGYDASYMRDLLDVSPWLLVRFMFVTQLGRTRGAPLAATAAAGIVGTLHEDCGPCTQIGVDLSLEAGLDPRILRAILAGERTAMGPDASLAYDFARASIARDMNTADPLREEILRRWGKPGLVAISLSLMTTRMYPTLKYALGHGRSCQQVVVSGVAAPVAHPEPLAA